MNTEIYKLAYKRSLFKVPHLKFQKFNKHPGMYKQLEAM